MHPSDSAGYLPFRGGLVTTSNRRPDGGVRSVLRVEPNTALPKAHVAMAMYHGQPPRRGALPRLHDAQQPWRRRRTNSYRTFPARRPRLRRLGLRGGHMSCNLQSVKARTPSESSRSIRSRKLLYPCKTIQPSLQMYSRLPKPCGLDCSML